MEMVAFHRSCLHSQGWFLKWVRVFPRWLRILSCLRSGGRSSLTSWAKALSRRMWARARYWHVRDMIQTLANSDWHALVCFREGAFGRGRRPACVYPHGGFAQALLPNRLGKHCLTGCATIGQCPHHSNATQEQQRIHFFRSAAAHALSTPASL